MIHSDSENLSWWRELSEHEKIELFNRIEERASSDALQEMVGRLRSVFQKGYALSSKQIETLRKWA